MVAKGQVFTGARALLSVGGVKVGYATGCSFREEIELQPVEALDNIEVEEHVPVRYRVSGSMEFVRVVGPDGTSPKEKGWFPVGGTNNVSRLTNILTSGELTVTLLDTALQKTVAQMERVRFSSNNMQVQATGIVGTNVDFVAIRLRDESEV